MAFWWITEALPIGLTSLLPIILFPMLGVLDGKAISNSYINYVIFLFIGGFIMALAIEKWNLHKRIALKILSIMGGSPFMILAGFMFSSAFLSMWMSNTATTMMMMPIAFSVILSLEDIHGESKVKKFSIGLLLSIAYACSIGGIATLVGTPPNLIFVRIFEINFPNAPEISFSQWLTFALPITFIMLIFTLLFLYLIFKPKKTLKKLNTSFFKNKYKELGKITIEEKRVLILFVVLIFLWVFRNNLNLGFITVPGWSSIFKHPKFLNDGTVAIFMAILLFIVPSSKKNEGLVNWKITKKIPWHIIFLFGGGFALAKGFQDSGLSLYVGDKLASASSISSSSLVTALTAMMSFLTEVTSNTASTDTMLPIISSLAIQLKLNPLLLMIPVTLAASMAFMLPIATPPNAIIFGSGKLKMIDMIKVGFFINLMAIIVISIATLILAKVIFNIDITKFPDWALQTVTVIKP
jgi:sodium-dependent dicarboxylate transporter 2/3/5